MAAGLPTVVSKYKTPLIVGVTLLLVLGVAIYFWASSNGYFQKGQQKPENVIAQVRGVAITEDDYKKFDKIYNSTIRYQNQIDPNVKLPTREETTTALKESVLIELESKKRNIQVTDEEIVNGLKVFNGAVYGLNNEESRELIKMNLLREKLSNAFVTWREFGYVTIRFDLLESGVDLQSLKPKAESILTAKKKSIDDGVSAAQIAEDIKNDPNYLKDFDKQGFGKVAVQYKDVPKDTENAKTVQKGKASLDEKVFTMKYPATEVWCTDAACYLIRVVGGNNGRYSSIDQWLKEELKK